MTEDIYGMGEIDARENATPKKPTIAELEKLLQSDDEVEIEILPNGEIRAKGQSTDKERMGRKPLTYRENLGGEYVTARKLMFATLFFLCGLMLALNVGSCVLGDWWIGRVGALFSIIAMFCFYRACSPADPKPEEPWGDV